MTYFIAIQSQSQGKIELFLLINLQKKISGTTNKQQNNVQTNVFIKTTKS